MSQRIVKDPDMCANSRETFGRALLAGHKKEAAPCTRPGPFKSTRRGSAAGVSELARHARERVLQLVAQGVHGRDDRNRDASGDQSVFDRGRAALVAQKTL